MGNYYHEDADYYRKVLKLEPPTTSTHGTESEVEGNLKQLMPSSWRLEGNQLIGQTEMGPLVQTIPTSHILTGTDKKGLPTFRKVDV